MTNMTKARIRQRQQGFTLAEMVIVVAGLAVLAGIWMMETNTKMQGDSHDSLIAAEANDLGLIANAVTNYVSTPPATWTAKGTAYQILITDLITAKDLPSSFANRNSAIGTTPFFQQYAIYGEIDASDNNPRVAIFDVGTISAARLERIGAANTANGILALKQAIGVQTTQSAKVAAGTIAPTAKIVTGNGNAWTKDLSAWLPVAPTVAAASVLIGYPDLTPGGTGTNPSGKWGYCNFYHPLYAPTCVGGGGSCQPAQCPAGWSALTTIPYCGGNSPKTNPYITPQYAVYPSDVGDVIISQEKVDDGAHWWITSYGSCSGFNCTPTPQYAMYDDYHYDSSLSVNGKQVDKDQKCYYRKYLQGYDLNDGLGCRIGNPQPPPSTRTPCVYTSGYTTDRPPAADQLTTQAVDLFCCQPR